MKRPQEAPPRALGSVSAGEVMPMAEFGRRLNLKNQALADAQRAGLRTILFGRCKFVLGTDAIEWFRRLGEAQAARAEGGKEA
jgi:hypothetical protein